MEKDSEVDDSMQDLTQKALRSFREQNMSFEDIKNISNPEKHRNPVAKNILAGLCFGVAAGAAIIFAAYILGIRFGNAETAFIATQFALLGALMTYINS